VGLSASSGLSYTRHVFLNDNEKERLNPAQTEFGLIVMMAEGCFAAAWYASLHPLCSNPDWWWKLGLFLLAASYPGPLQQHASECLRWRARERVSGAVSKVLRDYDLL
jgi:hypothetical protein